MALATPDELRDYLDVPYGELDDTRADLILSGVEGVILAYCNRETFDLVTADVTLNGTGSPIMLLPNLPVTACPTIVEDPRSVTYPADWTDLTNPTGSTLTLVEDVDYEWLSNGILRRLTRPEAPVRAVWRRRARWYVAHVTSGYASTPAALKTVELRLAARAVGNPEGLIMENAEGYRAGFGIDDSRLPTPSAADRRDLNRFRVEV